MFTQDCHDFDVLVIDDHSTDNSVSVVKEILAKYSEISSRHIINETNLGLNTVRNIAIREADGDYLFFVDGDDTIEPNTLTLFQQKMEETDAEVVCGSFRKTGFDGNTILEKRLPKYCYNGDFALATYIEKFSNPHRGIFPVTVWNKLYRLDYLRNHHIYCSEQHSFFEDQFFTFQVAVSAKNVAVIDTITYNYIQREDSLCYQKGDQKFANNIYVSLGMVFSAYSDFKESRRNESVPRGILYLLNMICLTEGLLYKFVTSDLSQKEKKEFLRWLKEKYRINNLHWNDIDGIYNKLSYAILFSPFPNTFFQCYYKHLKPITKLIKAFS